MVVADTANSNKLLNICAFFFPAVLKYCSKVSSVVAVSDNPLNTDDRYSLSLDFVETSRVLEILPSKSTRRKSWRTVRYCSVWKNTVSHAAAGLPG